MMSVHDLVVEVEEKVQGIILSFTEVKPEELGLDTRCAYKLYINEDFTFEIIKKPKLLHKTKATPGFIRQLAHNLSCKLIFRKIE